MLHHWTYYYIVIQSEDLQTTLRHQVDQKELQIIIERNKLSNIHQKKVIFHKQLRTSATSSKNWIEPEPSLVFNQIPFCPRIICSKTFCENNEMPLFSYLTPFESISENNQMPLFDWLSILEFSYENNQMPLFDWSQLSSGLQKIHWSTNETWTSSHILHLLHSKLSWIHQETDMYHLLLHAALTNCMR